MRKDDTFESERLSFRGINENDAKLLVKWRSDSEVIRFFRLPEPISMEQHLRWYEWSYRNNPNRYDYVIIDKETKRAIGTVGASKFSEENDWEVSYMIAETAYRRRGYAVEAIAAIMERLRQEGIACFVAEIHRENIASVKTVEKLGFQFCEEHTPFCIYCWKEVSNDLHPC